MRALEAARSVCAVLFLTLATAASSAAGQQPVAVSDADVGAAWRPAPIGDALQPRSGGWGAVDVRVETLPRRAAATGGVLTLPLPGVSDVRIAVRWSQSDVSQTFVAGPAVNADGEAGVDTGR